jgi:hypothetical protein
MNTPRPRRFKRRAMALLLGLSVSLLAAEVGLRVLLFWDTPLIARAARKLRQPGYYADMRREDVYWKLQRIWTPREQRNPFGRFSEKTGWTGALIDSQTLTMADEDKVGERRPVLLYGDSFAECVTPPEQAWQGLLERSPEGSTHALLNFGVSGFGVDQALTMLEATVPRFAERKPLVIFAIFLDEDPDRALLGFRGMPKPRYELVDGELVFRPLEETDPQAWWDTHPPGVPSYLWRLVRGPQGPLPWTWQQKLNPVADDAPVIALTRAILTRMHKELEAQGIEHFVLGFHGRMMLENPIDHAWRERFVRNVCSDLGLRFLSSRPFLMSAVSRRTELLGKSLFVTQGPFEGHYNARGNVVVLEAIRQALQGRYEREDVSGIPEALKRFDMNPENEQRERVTVLGRPSALRFHGASPTFALRELPPNGSGKTPTLGLFPASDLPTQVEWRLEHDARFSAEALAVPGGSADPALEAVRLQLLVDGEVLQTLELAPGGAAQPLEQALRGPCTFALRVEAVAGHENACWARLARPALE